MGGDGETWKHIGDAVPRLEIAMEAEEHFDIVLPEDVSHWLTLQDAYDTISLAIQS
jgi:acyl carrier protein